MSHAVITIHCFLSGENFKRVITGNEHIKPHSDGNGRRKREQVCACLLAEEVSMGKGRASSRKKLEHQFQETAPAPVIEKCSNYIFFL